MSKLALMFHGKFHCIKAINVRKKNIVQMRPLTAEIKMIIKFRATASSGMRKIFCVVIIHKKKIGVNKKCVKSGKNGAKCIRGIKI